MARAMTARRDWDEVTGGVALAEPPSAAATVRIPAPPEPAMTLAPRRHRYLPEVVAPQADTAIRLDVVNQITVGNGPIADIAASGDRARLVVTNHGDNSISMIDIHAGRVALTLTGVCEPFTVVAD